LAKKSTKNTGRAAAGKSRSAAPTRSRATAKPGTKKAAKPAAVQAVKKKPVATGGRAIHAPAGRKARAAGRAKATRVSSASAPALALAHAEDLSTTDLESAIGPVDSGLTAEDLDHFRRMLLEKRTDILGDVATLHTEALAKDRREAAGDLSSMPIHMADLGSDNYELEFTLGLIEGERVILREIDEALERVNNGTYGVCQATGKPIGKFRLRAKPWAKYCYEYTLAQEQGRGRRL
jgi:RNA polymerase-binding protein DksA